MRPPCAAVVPHVSSSGKRELFGSSSLGGKEYRERAGMWGREGGYSMFMHGRSRMNTWEGGGGRTYLVHAVTIPP